MLPLTGAVAAFRPTEYKMIASLSVAGFRGYETADLDGLARINVITGDNGSGKTTLLEAIWLAAGSGPQNLLSLRLWRGLGAQISLSYEPFTWRALWADLFHRTETPVAITMKSDLGDSSVFEAAFGGAQLALPLGELTSVPTAIPPLNLRWTDSDGTHEIEVTPALLAERVPVVRKNSPHVLFFSANSHTTVSPQEVAARFSSLVVHKKDAEIIRALKKEFPFIVDITVQVVGIPMLYVDTTLSPTLIPLAALSEGILKIVSYLTAAESGQRGVILIDEIGSGIFHDRQEWMWRVLLEACKRNENQIFATTHSAETLRALASLAADHPDDVALIRTARSESKCVARVFEGKYFESAVEQNIEVR